MDRMGPGPVNFAAYDGVVDLTEKPHTAGGKAMNSTGWQDE